MIDTDTAAGALWPDMPVAKDAPAGNPTTPEEGAQVADLWREPKAPPEVIGTPEVVKEARAADPVEKLWKTESLYEDLISLDLDGLSDEQKATFNEEQQATFKGQVIDMIASAGLSPAAAREFVMITGIEAPTPEVEAEWVADSQRLLLGRNNNDPKAAQADLELCQRLIARDPRIQRIAEAMDKVHVFNHPRVIELVLDAARAERKAGRLK